MTDAELLESLGHVIHSRQKCGCVRKVWWINRNNGEIQPQGWLALCERIRLKSEKQWAKVMATVVEQVDRQTAAAIVDGLPLVETVAGGFVRGDE